MLKTDLARLRSDLPRGVRAEIQPEDIQFAMDTIDRKVGRDGPTNAAHKTTAGIAWERVLIERVSDLVTRYRQLSIVAIRWKPPGISLDLDVIVHDHARGLVWVLDAKNAKRTDGQLEKMIDQIYFLKKHSDMLAGANAKRYAEHQQAQAKRRREEAEARNRQQRDAEKRTAEREALTLKARQERQERAARERTERQQRESHERTERQDRADRAKQQQNDLFMTWDERGEEDLAE